MNALKGDTSFQRPKEAEKSKKAGLVKKIVLAAGEALIQMGIFLQNIYQPPIEETLKEYQSALQNNSKTKTH